MRRLLAVVLALGALQASEAAPKAGDDSILDAAIIRLYAKAEHRDLAYKVLADIYAMDSDIGKLRRDSIVDGRYLAFMLEKDAAVIGLRGVAREKALAAYDAKKDAELAAKLAELEAEYQQTQNAKKLQ